MTTATFLSNLFFALTIAKTANKMAITKPKYDNNALLSKIPLTMKTKNDKIERILLVSLIYFLPRL